MKKTKIFFKFITAILLIIIVAWFAFYNFIEYKDYKWNYSKDNLILSGQYLVNTLWALFVTISPAWFMFSLAGIIKLIFKINIFKPII
mgnify:CR=1 FL=1